MDTRRRLIVRKTDVLVIGGLEFSGEVLREIVAPGKRLLWEFVRSEDGDDILPICYSEEQVLWLSRGDVERTAEEVKDLCRE